MRTPKSLAVCLAGVCLAMVSLAPPAAAQNVPFKVYVTELWQLDSGVDPGIGLIADYYARVTINGVELDNDGACDDGSLTGILVPYQLFRNFDKASECGARTPWVFSRDVPANQPVTVKIQIFDSDTAFDDEADLKPGSGSAIELTIDPATGQWSGDIAWPQQCSRPNLDLGSNNANVCWQIGFDADEDGLLDVWERSGADTNGDGTIDLDLASLGASPLRKDAFVEIDFLADASHSHGPLRDAVEDVVAAFANAPVANPDGTTGIQLHVDVGSLYGSGLVVSVPGMGGVTGTFGQLGTGGGDIIPEAGNEVIQQFGETGDGTPFLDLKAAHFASTRVYAFRYTIFGHQTNVRAESNDCTSGQAHRTRREFFVTLGGVGDDGDPCWGADSNGFSIGSIGQQGGTLMHELGHTLGLRHGGNVETNDKPNYLSVMNYSFQRCIVPASPGLLPGGCDYSRLVNGALLPDLDERSLDECVGVGAGMGEQDFDGDDVIEGVSRCEVIATNVRADTNNDGVCITAGSNGRLDTAPAGDDVRKGAAINDGPDRVCNTAVAAGSDDVQKTSVGSTPSQDDVLRSFDDWGNVTLSFFEFTPLSGSGAGEELEADPLYARGIAPALEPHDGARCRARPHGAVYRRPWRHPVVFDRPRQQRQGTCAVGAHCRSGAGWCDAPDRCRHRHGEAQPAAGVDVYGARDGVSGRPDGGERVGDVRELRGRQPHGRRRGAAADPGRVGADVHAVGVAEQPVAAESHASRGDRDDRRDRQLRSLPGRATAVDHEQRTRDRVPRQR